MHIHAQYAYSIFAFLSTALHVIASVRSVAEGSLLQSSAQHVLNADSMSTTISMKSSEA